MSAETKQRINPGAEERLFQEIKVLDHGFVKLIGYMGDDVSVEEAARISYGGGTRSVNETTGLIRYLRRNHHTTPFEMVELKFHIKIPLVVLAQMIRHRTASVNALSARYSILDKEFYIPESENIGVQSSINRQGRGEEVNIEKAKEFRSWLMMVAETGYEKYEQFLNDDGKGKPINLDEPMIARELARMGLSQNLYTQLIWKCDLHNIFHFLGLRKDKHAQYEIRQYADAMGDIVQASFPMAYKAFEDYELNAVSLSAPEQQIMQEIMKSKGIIVTSDEIDAISDQLGLTNKRERGEIKDKFTKIGITK